MYSSCMFVETASSLIADFHKKSIKLYNNLIGSGICREQARGILPQNLYTEYYGTVNLNNLFKFIRLRDRDESQWEIQVVAKACKDIGKTLFPVSFNASNL